MRVDDDKNNSVYNEKYAIKYSYTAYFDLFSFDLFTNKYQNHNNNNIIQVVMPQ